MSQQEASGTGSLTGAGKGGGWRGEEEGKFFDYRPGLQKEGEGGRRITEQDVLQCSNGDL